MTQYSTPQAQAFRDFMFQKICHLHFNAMLPRSAHNTILFVDLQGEFDAKSTYLNANFDGDGFFHSTSRIRITLAVPTQYPKGVFFKLLDVR